ncbi:MAG: hypothetical protein ACOX5Q_02775 [Bacillota bacterium]|nr:hypothetical protein [Candidatus Fermentithermobacillaceae bacterium]
MSHPEPVRITVTCMGHSGCYFPGGGETQVFECVPGETIEMFLERLGVNTDLFMYAVVGGEKRELSHVLRDGDDVLLVSPLMGG